MKKYKKEQNQDEENYIVLPSSNRFNYNDGQEEIAEILSTGERESFGQHASISYLGNYQKDELKAKQVYASFKDYNVSNARQAGLTTNNMIMMEQSRAFLKNPRRHTGQAINSILDSVERSYSISDDDRDIFSKFELAGDRKRIIDSLEDKGQKGDKKLLSALLSCDKLLSTLNEVENNLNDNFSVSAQKKLNKSIKQSISQIGYLNNIPFEEKNKIFRLSISDKENDSEELKEILSKNYIRATRGHDKDVDADADAERLKLELKGVDKLREQISIGLITSGDVNSEIRATHNFAKMYRVFGEATTAFKSKDEKEIKKIQKNVENLFGNSSKDGVGAKSLLADAQKFHNSKSEKKTDLYDLKTDGVLDEKKFKKMTIKVFEYLIEDKFTSKIENSKSKQKIIENLKELGDKLVEGDKKRVKGEVFSWSEIVKAYDDFQEKNTISLVRDNINNSDVSENLKQELLQGIEKKDATTSYAPSSDTRNHIADIMNFNAITQNEHIVKNVQRDEIDGVVKQSLSSKDLATFAKDGYFHKKKTKKQSKDVDFNERIKDIAGHQYGDYANGLLGSKLISLMTTRESLQEFSSCVQGSSVIKKSMDSKLSNTTECLDKLKTNIKKSADEMQQHISRSANGMGALNPFLHLQQIVAISRKLMSESISKDMRQISNNISGISQEISTAISSDARRARGAVLMSRSEGDINSQIVHIDNKDSLENEMKKEYISRELVDYNLALIDEHGYDTYRSKDGFDVVSKYTEGYIPPKITEEKNLTDEIKRKIASQHDGEYKDINEDSKELNALGVESGVDVSFQSVSNTKFQNDDVESLNADSQITTSKYREYSSHRIVEALKEIDRRQKDIARGFLLNKEQKEAFKSNEYKKLEEDKMFLSYDLIVKSLEEIRDNGVSDSHRLRPKSKIVAIIKEMKGIFNPANEKKPLEQRNSLSNAMSILLSDGSKYANMQDLFKTSSIETEFKINDIDDEIGVLAMACHDKSYLLKINKDSREEKRLYGAVLEKEELTKLDSLEYRSDISLLEHTKAIGSATVLSNWSDYIISNAEFANGVNTVAEASQTKIQIDNSASAYSNYKGDNSLVRPMGENTYEGYSLEIESNAEQSTESNLNKEESMSPDGLDISQVEDSVEMSR